AKEPSVPATKRYLAAIDNVLSDIKNLKEGKNYEKTATWHLKAADQIDQLSTLGVDPLAASAAQQTSNRLRAIGASLRGVPIDVDALSKQQSYSFTPY